MLKRKKNNFIIIVFDYVSFKCALSLFFFVNLSLFLYLEG